MPENGYVYAADCEVVADLIAAVFILKKKFKLHPKKEKCEMKQNVLLWFDLNNLG